jgi:hypothetical protein
MSDPEGLTKAEYVEQIEATRGGRKRIHEPGCGVKASEPCTCSLPLATNAMSDFMIAEGPQPGQDNENEATKET